MLDCYYQHFHFTFTTGIDFYFSISLQHYI